MLGGASIISTNKYDSVVDLRSIDFPAGGDIVANARRFFEKVKNPYLFRVDDIIVHVEFGDQSCGSLQHHIQNLLSRSAACEA